MKSAGEFKLDGKNAEDLIRAFFEEFNPKSTLHINGYTANAEIFFEENPPMKIVNAISRCNILSFDYEESEERYMDDEVGAKETEKSDGGVEVNNETEADSEGETGNSTESDSGVETSNETESDSEVESNNESESGKHCIPPPPINFLKVKANNETQSNSRVETGNGTESDSGVETSNETESDSEVESNNESESGKHCIPPPPINFLKVKANNETQSNSRVEKCNETNSNNEVEESNEPQLDSKVQPTGNVAAKPEYNTIPELTSIAKEVSSYEMFLNAVMDWLKLGVRETKRMCEQRRSAFLSIEAVVSNGYDSWNQIESHATYNSTDRLVLGDTVSKKMQECGYQKIKILKFFRILVSYKKYEFENATVTESVANDNGTDMTSNHLNTEETKTSVTKADTNESTNNDAEVIGKADTDTGTETVEKVDTDAEIVEKTDTDAETEVTMPCFSEIPWFVDFLKSIDKTKTIEEKVKQVLFKMNLNNSKNTDVKEEILNLAIEAMKTEHIEDMIKQKPWKLRMDFATFLNDFAGEYSTSKVIARDFLKDLQGALV